MTRHLFSSYLVFVFTFMGGALFAQDEIKENEVLASPVKITAPHNNIVLRSFTLSGRAQAGAKLELSINGKIFGRYRADIKGHFTIGISVPENTLNIEITHVADSKRLSSDHIILRVEDTLREKEVVLPTPKSDPKKTDTKMNTELPQSTATPRLPQELKNTGLKSTAPKPSKAKKRNVFNAPTRPYPASTPQTPPTNRALRIAIESVGLVGFTAVNILLTSLVINATNDLGEGIGYLGIAILIELTVAPLVVYGTGKTLGGRGKVWAPFLGEALGIVAAIGIGGLASNTRGENGSGALSFLALLTPFVTTIFAYEISHNMNKDEPYASWNFRPILEIQSNSVRLGMGAHF